MSDSPESVPFGKPEATTASGTVALQCHWQWHLQLEVEKFTNSVKLKKNSSTLGKEYSAETLVLEKLA